MDNNTTNFATLPTELLHGIFRRLDPAALIATSQTCAHFRSLISPARKHFVERLLALEIEPEHGGPGFTFFAREGRLDPDWNEESWDRMRWACTHCLRLLGHAAFDNHSLLRLRNRKPEPGTPVAKRLSGVTSWEPVEMKALSAKQERRKRVLVAEEKQREKLLRKQYLLATTKSLGAPQGRYTSQTRTSFLRAAELPESLELSDPQLDALTEVQEHELLDRAARRIEGLRAGSHRHLRKCNECRFRLGHFRRGPSTRHCIRVPGRPVIFSWAHSNKGTPQVPIVRSRQLKFATPFDRYFPGVGSYMSGDRPGFILPLWRVYREDVTYILGNLYMARCPSCAIWQELRAFRWRPRGWGYGKFIGIEPWMDEAKITAYINEVQNMQCNQCLHDKFGHTALAEQLALFMRELLDDEGRDVLRTLSVEWRTLRYTADSLHENHGTVKQLVQSLEAAEGNFAKIEHNGVLREFDIDADDLEDNLALMNRRRLEWLHISLEQKKLADACVENSKSFAVWHNQWDEAMAYWRWTRAWSREAEDKPDKVVRWALERSAVKLN